MFTTNFWGWLLIGAGDLLSSLISPMPQHASMGLVALVGVILVYALTVIVFFIGSFFHLEVFALTLGAIILLEGVRGGIAAYRWLVGFLPLP